MARKPFPVTANGPMKGGRCELSLIRVIFASGTTAEGLIEIRLVRTHFASGDPQELHGRRIRLASSVSE